MPSLKNYAHNASQAAFTLLEVLIAVAILGVLSSLGLVVTWDFYNTYAINSERDMLVGVLQKARSRAVTNINQSPHGVHIDPEQYVIFQGVHYDPLDPLNQKVVADKNITHSGTVEVVFTQLSGDALAEGSIYLTDGKITRDKTISVNIEGRIDW